MRDADHLSPIAKPKLHEGCQSVKARIPQIC